MKLVLAAGWRKGTAAAGGARGETPTSNVRAVWGREARSAARRSNAKQSSVLPVKLYPPHSPAILALKCFTTPWNGRVVITSPATQPT